jgi:hypothetical protein
LTGRQVLAAAHQQQRAAVGFRVDRGGRIAVEVRARGLEERERQHPLDLRGVDRDRTRVEADREQLPDGRQWVHGEPASRPRGAASVN